MENKIYEYCPYCNDESIIDKNGGICEHCGNYLKPCSLCNMNKVNCNKCKFNGIKIEKYQNGYVIMYKNYHTCKLERPTVWHLDNEACQIFTTEQFAKNDIRSFKKYITKQYNGDFEAWEEEQLCKLSRR